MQDNSRHATFVLINTETHFTPWKLSPPPNPFDILSSYGLANLETGVEKCDRFT